MTARRPVVRADLVLVLATGLLCCAAMFAFPHLPVVRAAVGLPFMLFGVGYATMRALMARRPCDLAMQIVLSLALSVVAAVLVGLSLYVLGIGFDGRAVIAGEVVIAVIASGFATIREPGRLRRSPISLTDVLSSGWSWALLIAAATFAAGVVYLARPLPDASVASYAALSAVRADSSNVRISVANEGQERLSYELQIKSRGATATRVLSLASGEDWTRNINVGPSVGQQIVVSLYVENMPGQIYRQVILRG